MRIVIDSPTIDYKKIPPHLRHEKRHAMRIVIDPPNISAGRTKLLGGPGGNGGLLLEDNSGYLLLEDGSFLLLE